MGILVGITFTLLGDRGLNTTDDCVSDSSLKRAYWLWLDSLVWRVAILSWLNAICNAPGPSQSVKLIIKIFISLNHLTHKQLVFSLTFSRSPFARLHWSLLLLQVLNLLIVHFFFFLSQFCWNIFDKILNFFVYIHFIVNLKDHVFIIKQWWVHDQVPFLKIINEILPILTQMIMSFNQQFIV